MKKILLLLFLSLTSLSVAYAENVSKDEKADFPPDSAALLQHQNRWKTNNSLDVFPNPVVTQATIKYQIENGIGEIKIYNLLGTLVRNIPLQDKQGVALLRAADYKSGIYFCSLEVNGRIVETKKIVVK